MITETENQNYVQYVQYIQMCKYLQKKFRWGFENCEKDKNKRSMYKTESFYCTRVKRNYVRFLLTKKP